MELRNNNTKIPLKSSSKCKTQPATFSKTDSHLKLEKNSRLEAILRLKKGFYLTPFKKHKLEQKLKKKKFKITLVRKLISPVSKI